MERLRQLYLQAELDIIAALSYKRRRGLVDYAEAAALERVQRILEGMIDEAWEYVPRMVELEFYALHPEARAIPESVGKHLAGYGNAFALTTTQTAVAQRLIMNLMGELLEAAGTVQSSLPSMLIGRLEPDLFRTAGLQEMASMVATGAGTWESSARLAARLRREGITAFVDKAGRKWALHTYADMVTRTTRRQAEILAVLTGDEVQDLYKISAHGTTCPVCAPLEGRVYSKSGENPDYPPLSAAFGKIDPKGPEDLTNTYLNIHPNCLHVLTPYTTAGMTAKEIRRDKDFSSFVKNPPTVDPRTKAQIEAYRKKEDGRRKYLAMVRQFERYRLALGDKMPRTVQTFIKHKLAGDAVYQSWEKLYRQRI